MKREPELSDVTKWAVYVGLWLVVCIYGQSKIANLLSQANDVSFASGVIGGVVLVAVLVFLAQGAIRRAIRYFTKGNDE